MERRRGGDRRRLTLRSFLQGGFNPRRRGGRRAGEQHLPIDWHEPYLLFLALTILLLSVADAFLTLTLIMGGAQEANPLLAYVLRDRPEWFAAIKMVLTGGGVLVDPGNPEALAAGIHRLWSNRALSAQLSGSAYEGVRAHYTVASSATRLLEVYETVRRRAPAGARC